MMTRLAHEAAAAGHRVALPDLTSITTASHPTDEFITLAVEAACGLPGLITVIGEPPQSEAGSVIGVGAPSGRSGRRGRR